MAAPSLVEKLKPDHLEEPVDPEAIKKKLDEKSGKQDPFANDPKGQEKYTFPFRWVDGRGKVWEGQFTNKILTIGERQLAGALRSHLARGISAGVLDDFTNELNLIISHLTYSLTEKPDWAQNLTDLQNPRVLQALYEEVLAHEATFLGLGPIAGGGKA